MQLVTIFILHIENDVNEEFVLLLFVVLVKKPNT